MKVFKIDEETSTARLDRFLRKRLPHTPLTAIFGFVRKGQITVNGKKSTPEYRLWVGDTVEINLVDEDVSDPHSENDNMTATNFFKRNFKIVYEDDAIMVCDKPVGVVVHSGLGHTVKDTLVDLANAYLNGGGRMKRSEAYLVHRLDRDTSGVILLTKNKEALQDLSRSFKVRDMDKVYLAVVHGKPKELSGTIDARLDRVRGDDEMTRVMVNRAGQEAKTEYKVLATTPKLSLLECRLLTGRTHQIRVHLEHIGCPILGDRMYGDADKDAVIFGGGGAVKRLYLHAWRMSFEHPTIGRDVSFEAEVPEAFTIASAGKKIDTLKPMKSDAPSRRVEKPAPVEKPAKVFKSEFDAFEVEYERSQGVDRGDAPAKSSRAERPSRTEKSPAPARSSRTEKSSGAGRSTGASSASRADRSNRTERPPAKDASSRTERPSRSEKTSAPARSSRTEKPTGGSRSITSSSSRAVKSSSSDRTPTKAPSSRTERPSRTDKSSAPARSSNTGRSTGASSKTERPARLDRSTAPAKSSRSTERPTSGRSPRTEKPSSSRSRSSRG